MQLEQQNAALQGELELLNPKFTKDPGAGGPVAESSDVVRSIDAVSTPAERKLDFESTEALIKALKDGVAWPKEGTEFWRDPPRKDGEAIVLSDDLQDVDDGGRGAVDEAAAYRARDRRDGASRKGWRPGGRGDGSVCSQSSEGARSGRDLAVL